MPVPSFDADDPDAPRERPVPTREGPRSTSREGVRPGAPSAGSPPAWRDPSKALYVPLAERGFAAESRLQPVLADLLRLGLHARHLGWNATGPTFLALRAMFGEFVASYGEWADRLAERMRSLGAAADGRPRALSRAADGQQVAARELDRGEAAGEMSVFVGGLAARVAAILDGWSGDPVTRDLLTALLEGLDRQAWLLRAQR